MQDTTKKTHGGAGRGQGRKTTRPQKAHPFRIYKDLLTRMRHVSNVNKFINDAIEERLNRLDAIEKAAKEFEDIN